VQLLSAACETQAMAEKRKTSNWLRRNAGGL